MPWCALSVAVRSPDSETVKLCHIQCRYMPIPVWWLLASRTNGLNSMQLQLDNAGVERALLTTKHKVYMDPYGLARV